VNIIKPDIVIINGKCYPLHSDGGTAITTFEIASQLAKSGYKVLVLVPNNNYIDQIIISNNFYILYVGLLRFAYTLLQIRMHNKRTVVLLNSAFQIYGTIYYIIFQVLNKDNITYCAAHGSYDKKLMQRSSKKMAWLSFIDKRILRLSKQYLANSLGEIKNMQFQAYREIEDRFYIVENKPPLHMFVYDLKISKDKKIQPDKSIIQKKPYILYLGRVVPKKRLFETITLLEASGWFSEGLLWVVEVNSDQKYLDKIIDLISEKALRKKVIITRNGLTGIQKWFAIYNSSASILLSESEGLPMFLLESKMLGVPVMYTMECNYTPVESDILIRSDLGQCGGIIPLPRVKLTGDNMSISDMESKLKSVKIDNEWKLPDFNIKSLM